MSLELILEVDVDSRELSTFLKFADKVLEYCNLMGYEISLLLCDDEKIRELNLKWRSVDSPTDVLSFPMQDKKLTVPLNFDSDELFPTSGEKENSDDSDSSHHTLALPSLNGDEFLLGDIAISVDTAVVQASERGISLSDELSLLFVHGLLHLCGYDHLEEEDFAEMKKKEEEILSACFEGDIVSLLGR